MPDDTNIQRTFSIWREFHPSRPLAHRLAGEAPVIFHTDSAPEEDSGLYEEIYRWHLREDILAGITEEGVRSEVDDVLKRLDAAKPPSARQLDVLRDFINLARTRLNEGAVDPVLWNEPNADPREEGTDAVEVNSLLSLTLHLEWIVACFEGRPGISVSVR